MQVKITRQTFVGGDPVKAGKVITVSEADGRSLIAGGKAIPVDAAEKAAPENRADDGAGASTK